MPPKPEAYISVDVEASGPIPGEYSLLSIGACIVTNTCQNFYSELKPLNNNFIARAMAVNGLSLAKLKKVSAETKPVFVGFNATFDWSFTHWYFMKFLGHDPFGISGLDIKAYFMGRHRVSWRETNKKRVRSLYPSQTGHTHNALDDAKEQAEIFAQLVLTYLV